MPSIDNLLAQLEEAKRQFGPGNGDITERLLSELAKHDFPDAESLIRFHEALLFIRSHPQSPGAFQTSQNLLSKFGEYVDRMRTSGADMTPFDYIEYSGIARTVISGTFSYDIARFLLRQHRSRIEADWNQPSNPERFGSTLPRFVPLLYEDSLVEANIPYYKWLNAAASRKNHLAWLLRRFEALNLPARNRAELYDSLGLRILWGLGDTGASRSRNITQVN